MTATAQPINVENVANDPLAFPIYVLTPGTVLPDDGSYYVISQNGLWFRKDTGIMRGMVKVDGVGQLEPLVPTIGMRIPVLPEAITLHSLIFFRKVYSKYHAESELQLFYNKDTGKFRLFCPEQTVSYSSVKYKPDQWNDPTNNLAGFLLVGTIHSHCNFSASHSSTDLGDERHADGIHITFGHIDNKEFSCVCSMQLNQQRVSIDPRIKLKGLEIASRSGYKTDYYRLKLPTAKHTLKAIIVQLEDEIEKEWMPKVGQEFFRPAWQESGYSGSYGSYNGSSNRRDTVRNTGLDVCHPVVDSRESHSVSFENQDMAQSIGDRSIGELQPESLGLAEPPIAEIVEESAEVSFRQTEEATKAEPQKEEQPRKVYNNEKKEGLI